ncbi:DEAD/DEAH box helicase [Salinarimonas rosea]|uniref:DEAD/DEAH box helicase n=1 Tax=Salinarimonas rosea TaxID=552063 RepID=UPI0004202B6F|nr:DEAD/DEAH box helicase [Salinarimonas rosea]
MTPTFEPGAAVRHDRHGEGVVVVQAGDLVVVEFESAIQRVPAGELRPAASLAAALAGGALGDPVEAVLRGQALAIGSVNDQWGVFSRSRVQILPHQLWVCRKVTSTWPFRWLVADDVGLGKTIEAGLVLMPLIASGRVRRLLVLAPAKLVPQWRARLKTMFDIRLQQYVSASDSARSNFWDTATMAVASFHTLRSDSRGARGRLLDAEGWDLVIVDEAHHLNLDERSGDTLAYGLLRELRDRGKIESLILFTGTPHRGKDWGFFGLMNLLRPDLFDPQADRAEQLPRLSQAMIRNNKATVTDLRGRRLFEPVRTQSRDYAYSPHEREFYDTLSAFILDGRAYAISLGGRAQTARMLVLVTLQKLAASSVAAILSALGKRRAKLASMLAGARAGGASQTAGPEEADDEDAAGDFAELLLADEISRLDELLALGRAIPRETKIERMLGLLENEIAAGEQVLFFTEYKATQALVVNALQERFGFGSATFINGDERLDGVATPLGPRTLSVGREAAADDFNGGAVRFLVSTEAGGEGIDLQERCSTLVHVDMPWNPMRLHQRVGRLSRYGQTKTVDVFLMRNPDTVEARIWDLLTEKLQRIQDALSNAMEEREDITQLVIGIAGEAFFDELYAGAQGRSGESLAAWFDRTASTFGGRDVIDTARDLFGNVARFDFQAVGRDVPQVDLPALEPFFAGVLAHHGRRVARAEDGALAFKTPDAWRSRSWSVDERYEGLVFDRTLKGEGAATRVLGVGHQLVNLALDDARALEVRSARLDGLEAPLLIASVRDAVTGLGATARRVVLGATERGAGEVEILADWELLVRLNHIATVGRRRAARPHEAEDASDAARVSARLLAALAQALPTRVGLFARPEASAEMLLLPAGPPAEPEPSG